MAKSAFRKVANTLQITKDYSVKPAGLQWRSNTLFIVATVAVGLFTDLFLYGLVVPILPFMLQDRVGLPKEQIQSSTSGLLAAYAAASVVFSPIAGILADRISTRQAPFLLGLTALLAATVLLFIGTTMPVLVVARLLQGISAAFVWTIGLALCLETVGPENLGKTIGSVRGNHHGVATQADIFRSSLSSPSVTCALHYWAVCCTRRLAILASSALRLPSWPSTS